MAKKLRKVKVIRLGEVPKGKRGHPPMSWEEAMARKKQEEEEQEE